MNIKCFIYAITHIKSGRRYIGSTVNIAERWITHRSQLNTEKHHCDYLQNSWTKYGSKSFSFSILKMLPSNTRSLRRTEELRAIASNECFNSRIANLEATNFENNTETRIKIKKGIYKRMSDDKKYVSWLKKRGAGLAAHARLPENRKRRSILSKKLWKDPEHRKRVSAKLAKYWLQPGIKEEHSVRVKLHAGTPESRKKKSDASKLRSSELSALMSKTNKKRWSDPKAKKIQAAKMHAYHVKRRAALPAS